MGFRGRWTLFLLLLAVVGVFFLVPMKTQCHCQSCDTDEGVRSSLRGSDIRSKKDLPSELNNTRPRKWHNDGMFGRKRAFAGQSHVTDSAPRVYIPGWIADCVTWEKKWEMSSPDVEPRAFNADLPQLGYGEEPNHMRKTFQEIFEKRDWPAHDASYTGLQSSGPGAMLKNSQRAMAILHSVITKLKASLGKSEIALLDLPCGDLQWMSKFLMTRSDIRYTGADIVPDLIANHREKFFRIPKATFLEFDAVEHPLNKSFDLIFTRDLLQHLWRVDAMRILDHISKSGSLYLLTTTFPDTTSNLEVEKDALGGRRSPYNLELPPFSLPSPACMSYDWNVEHLALWSLPLRQKYDS